MAVAFKSSLGTAVATASATTLVITTTNPIAVGDLLVLRWAADNLSATTPTLTTCVTSGGDSFTNQQQRAAQATAAAGIAGGLTICKATVAVATGGTITLTLSGAVAAKSAYCESFTGCETTQRSAAVGVTATTGALAPASPTTINAGDLVLTWGSYEDRNNVTGDSDTTGGSWSAIVNLPNATSGTAGTRVLVCGQYKITTASGNQTWTATGPTADCVGGIVVLQATPPVSITQAAYRFYADGTEAGSTALGTQSTAYTADVTAGDVNLGARIRLQSTTTAGPPNTTDFQLQYQINSGTWVSIGAGSGTETLADSYAETNADTNFTPTNVGEPYAQSFTGNGQKLSSASFWLTKSGTVPAGTSLVVRLYAHTGTYGSSTGLPTGAPLATATPKLASSFSATAHWENFVFDSTVTLVNGTRYCVSIETDTANTVGNCCNVAIDNSAPSHGGVASSFFSGGWNWSGGPDICFRVYTQAVSTTGVVPFASANLTDGAATTNRLGAGTNSFSAGEISETGMVVDNGWTANNYTEMLYSITLKKADLANADTIAFRVLKDGATTDMTYTVTPTITIAKTTATYTQAAYRWYDEGTETGAVALAAQDTAASGDVTLADGIGQLRVRLQNTNAFAGDATDDWQVQWEKNASGTWTNVTTGGTTARGYNSPNLTEAAVTTSRLTGGTGTFVAGKVSEDGLVDNLAVSASNYTELLYSLDLVNTDLVNGDTLRFRVLYNGATTGVTYSSVPTINVVKAATDQTWTGSTADIGAAGESGSFSVPAAGASYTERVDAQSATSFGAGGYTPAAFTPTAGNYLVVIAQSMSDAGAIDTGAVMTISDSQSMAWTKIGDVGDAASWGIGIAAWISAAVPASTSTTITIDAGTNIIYDYFVWCAEIAGGDGTTAGYVEDTTAVLDGAETLTLAAPPTADDVCIGASFVDCDGALTPTAGSGASLVLSRSDPGGGGDAAVVVNDALASTSFALFTDRRTLGTGTYKGVSMAFIVKAAGGGGPGPQTWSGSTADMGAAGQSGAFVGGAVTWGGSSGSITTTKQGADQHHTGLPTAVTTVVSGSFTPAVGDTVAVAVNHFNTNGTTVTFTPSVSGFTVGSWTEQTITGLPSGQFFRTSILYAKVTSSAAGTVTITRSGGSLSCQTLASFYTLANAGTPGSSSGTDYATNTGTGSTLTATITAATNNALMFGVVVDGDDTATVTPPSGWTEHADYAPVATGVTLEVASLANAAANPQWSSLSVDYTNVVVVKFPVGSDVALIGVAGQSGEFTAGAASPQTWAGSTADAGAAGQSGTFVGGAVTWAGSTANIGAAGQTGAFVAGVATWAGTNALMGVAGQSGAFVGGAVSWASTNAAIGAAGQSGTFVASAVTWVGTTNAAMGAAGQSGTLVGGAVTWVGSTADIGAAGTSGAFVAGGGPQTWVGTDALMGAAGQSAAFAAGAITWVGSTATAGAAGQSGTFVSVNTIVGSTATMGAAGQSGTFAAGAISWTATSAATFGIAGQSGTFTPGTATWAGSTATIGMAYQPGAFSSVVTWAGSTAEAGAAGQSGAFVPGTATWVGSTATMGAAGQSGLFTSLVTWVGSTADIGAAGQSGTMVGGATTWAGTNALIGVAGTAGQFVSGSLWTSTQAFIGVAGQSGSFVGAAITWTGGSTATFGIAGQSGLFTYAWPGTTATIGAAGQSGAFLLAQTWVGSTATIGAAGQAGSFSSGALGWTGSTADIGLTGQSGAFVPGTTVWVGTTATIGLAGQPGLFVPGVRVWAGSTATMGAAGQSGAFSTGITVWVGSTAQIGPAGQSGLFLGGASVWISTSVAMVGVAGRTGSWIVGAVPIYGWINGQETTALQWGDQPVVDFLLTEPVPG